MDDLRREQNLFVRSVKSEATDGRLRST